LELAVDIVPLTNIVVDVFPMVLRGVAALPYKAVLGYKVVPQMVD